MVKPASYIAAAVLLALAPGCAMLTGGSEGDLIDQAMGFGEGALQYGPWALLVPLIRTARRARLADTTGPSRAAGEVAALRDRVVETEADIKRLTWQLTEVGLQAIVRCPERSDRCDEQ